MSLLMAFNTFGEEYGWRAYMNPKMEALMGKPATVILGGILWGLWHAPLTAVGHNFGTDYWGFPWMGMVLMSVLCIFTGMFLMWLTQKSHSIYPAAIAHAANNNGSSMMRAVFLRGVTEESLSGMSALIRTGILFIPLIAVYGIFGFLLRQKKEEKPAEANAA